MLNIVEILNEKGIGKCLWDVVIRMLLILVRMVIF